MINLFRLLIVPTVLGLSVGLAAGQSDSKLSKEKLEAERTWEALVNVKGGRERLHSVSSVLFTLYKYNKKAKGPASNELHILPGKIWRTGYHFDRSLTTYRCDASVPLQEWANSDGTGDSKEGGRPGDSFSMYRVVYLLETRYEKPTPLRVVRRKIGGKNYDILETLLKDQRIDFYFEPEVMLVTQVILFFDDMTPWETYDFFDYTEIDGIKMPQRETLNDAGPWPIGIAFNVDYDPNLFQGPLKSAPLDAWKRKSQ